ncbi:MAG: DUF2283 domain-containing protein [archaeon]
MSKKNLLEAPEKGELTYDYRQDILTFKVKDRDYKMSIEFQNFIFDFNAEDFITGIRIFDVSKVSGLNKLVFNNLVHGAFNASIKDNVISVRLNFVGKMRNKYIPLFSKEEKFTQQISASIDPKHPMQDSEVSVPEIVVS